MNVTDALYRAAHNYPHGGMDALALRMGISVNSLQHKVSPTYPGAHCSPLELVQICEYTGDHSALTAIAGRLGYVLLPVSQLDGDCEGTRELVATVREFGQFVTEVSQDLSDGRVTDTELRRIEKEGAEAMAAIQRLMSVAEQLNESGKPPALRGVRAA